MSASVSCSPTQKFSLVWMSPRILSSGAHPALKIFLKFSLNAAARFVRFSSVLSISRAVPGTVGTQPQARQSNPSNISSEHLRPFPTSFRSLHQSKHIFQSTRLLIMWYFQMKNVKWNLYLRQTARLLLFGKVWTRRFPKQGVVQEES